MFSDFTLQSDYHSLFFQCVGIGLICIFVAVFLLRILLQVLFKFTLYSIVGVVVITAILLVSEFASVKLNSPYFPSISSTYESLKEIPKIINKLQTSDFTIDKKGENYGIKASYTPDGSIQFRGQAKLDDAEALTTLVGFASTLIDKTGTDYALENINNLTEADARKQALESFKTKTNTTFTELQKDPKKYFKKYEKEMKSETGIDLNGARLYIHDDNIVMISTPIKKESK